MQYTVPCFSLKLLHWLCRLNKWRSGEPYVLASLFVCVKTRGAVLSVLIEQIPLNSVELLIIMHVTVRWAHIGALIPGFNNKVIGVILETQLPSPARNPLEIIYSCHLPKYYRKKTKAGWPDPIKGKHFNFFKKATAINVHLCA